MPTAMTVRCVQCGQENNPQYRFCGMCGAPLGPPPAPVASEVGHERMRPPVSGPSFLGLGDERTRDLDYLLEDDPPRGHGRLYLALFLLILSGGLLAWHWQRDGYPWKYTPTGDCQWRAGKSSGRGGSGCNGGSGSASCAGRTDREPGAAGRAICAGRSGADCR